LQQSDYFSIIQDNNLIGVGIATFVNLYHINSITMKKTIYFKINLISIYIYIFKKSNL